MLGSLRFRRTTLIIIGCAAFLLGLGVSRFGYKLSITWILIILPVFIVLIRKKTLLTALSIFALFILVGWLRGQDYLSNINIYEQLSGKKVVLNVTADSDSVYDDRKELSFDSTNIQVTKPVKTGLIGKIKVAGFGENSIYKGDQLTVEGKLYKTRGSKQASIGFAQLRVVRRGNSPIDNVRRNFAAGLSNVLPEPQAPFGLGLLIGQRTNLGDEATTWLSNVV